MRAHSPFTIIASDFYEAPMHLSVLTQISELDVSEHVEAALLDVVDEGDEADAAARIRDHQQDLRPPELHVVLSHVQHQQVLADLLKDDNSRMHLNFMLINALVLWTANPV